jgi:hypothetical protein
VNEEASRLQWKLSYAAIDPGENNEPVESSAPVNDQPVPKKLGPDDFRRGDAYSGDRDR